MPDARILGLSKNANFVYRDGEWTAWDGSFETGTDYKASDIDIAADTKYYGFLNTDGRWYIMKEVTTAGSFRFTKGTADYATGWTGRAAHSYGYYDVIF